MCSTHHVLQCFLYPQQRIGILLGTHVPSFFLTSTTALHHGNWLEHMDPASNIFQSEAHTSSSSSGGISLNCSLKGLLSVIRISCSTALVHPSSFPSNMKTSWRASMRSCATTAFQGVQLLRPSKSNFSRSLPCHSTMDRGCHLSSAPRTASISGNISADGTGDAETTLATHMPFFRKIKDSDMFLTTTDTLLLLILSLVYACRTCNLGGRGHAPPRLSFPSPQGCHHDMGTFPNEWFGPALQYLGLEWSKSNILFHEDWLIQVLTHGGLECHSSLFHRAITSHAWVLCHSALLAQQTGCSDHRPRSLKSTHLTLLDHIDDPSQPTGPYNN